MTRFLMVWGTSSGAGKSWLATALCRLAAREGLRVRPFKAQNMSNNARVVAGPDGEGAEIGAAQYFQALAARARPSVDMNPVLLKPERDTASQVIVHGRVDAAMSRQGWIERQPAVAAAARASLARLAAQADLVVIEGAGSPAEINLAPHDVPNLATARWARELGLLRSLLVSDIDRGGAFAHLYGTWALLPDDLRPTLSGHVLNRFRGDAALLPPGPAMLQALTGVPVVGVIPMLPDPLLPEEDGLFDVGWNERFAVDAPSRRQAGAAARAPGDEIRIAIVCAPHISNLDEFAPLRRVPGVRLAWVRTADALAGADWIVLPGSKQVSGDLAWLRANRLDEAIARHAAAGGAVLGLCGGLQMLGEAIVDPDGHDGEAGVDGPGLGLLPLVTRFERTKRVCAGRVRFDAIEPIEPIEAIDAGGDARAGSGGGPWSRWAGLEVDGYEIRCGRTVPHPSMAPPRVALRDALGEPIGWQSGGVLGLYAHGLFESPAVLRAMFGATVPTLDDDLDRLADVIATHLDRAWLDRVLHGRDD
jgi:adenosylcobyric acid synthase